MLVKIDLRNNKGFKWYSLKTNNLSIYAKGFFFVNNDYYEKKKLLDYFKDAISLENLKDKINNVNGHFLIIIETKEKIFIAADTVRSFNILYRLTHDYLHITDFLQEKYYINTDTVEFYEVLLSGAVINNNTLLQDYKQIQGGEILVFNKKTLQLTKKKYFVHYRRNFFDKNEDDIIDDLDQISYKMFDRLIKSAGNKKIIVSLSGGYDSRFILAGLKKLGHNNVACMTYGISDSYEVKTARNIAKKLNYPCYTAVYTKDKWTELFFNKKFLEYIFFSSNYSSSPHIKDLLAINELVTEKIINPGETVLVLGHGGDPVGGSKLSTVKNVKRFNISVLLKYLYKEIFYMADISIPDDIKTQIDNEIKKNLVLENDEENLSRDSFYANFEKFILEHRMLKYINNSVRTIEFYDIEWRLPLWDREWISYWYQMPYKWLFDKYLYDKYLFEKFFIPLQINYKQTEYNIINKLSNIRDAIPFLHKLSQQIKKALGKNIFVDNDNFNVIFKLIKEAKHPPFMFKHMAAATIYYLIHFNNQLSKQQ